jgi:hypothetical protein
MITIRKLVALEQARIHSAAPRLAYQNARLAAFVAILKPLDKPPPKVWDVSSKFLQFRLSNHA